MESISLLKRTQNLVLLGVVTLAAALCCGLFANVSQAQATIIWDGGSVSSLPSNPWSGSGTSSNPYLIQDLTDLQEFVYAVNNDSSQTYNQLKTSNNQKYWKLMDDIQLNSTAVAASDVNIANAGVSGLPTPMQSTVKEWVPIGGAACNYSFKGVFDGNDKVVYNIFYNHSDGGYASGNSQKNNAGFFGKVEVGAEVNDLTLNGGYFGGQRSIGAIAGKSWGWISGCTNTGVYVYANQSKGVGGIVGANWVDTTLAPIVDNCTNNGTVVSAYSSGSAGGIAGENEGVVRNCRNYGSVASPYNAGGMVGSNKNVKNKQTPTHTGETGDPVNSSIMNCYNGYGSSVIGVCAGGIAGYQACEAQNCYSIGSVSAYPTAGTTYVGQAFGQLSSTATNDYLFWYYGTSPTGSGTISGTHCNTFTDANTLLGYLNGWVGTTNPVYYRWLIDNAKNGGWPIHDLTSLYTGA